MMNTTFPAPHIAAYSDGILVYICIAMLTGIVGNALVFYAFKTEMSGFNTIVTVLSVFDSLACLVHMPLDIVSLFDPYIFPQMIACKITCFMISFTAIGSAILLVAIATMRFKAVCRPYDPNLSVKQAKIISFIAFCTAVGLSWPAFLIFGVTTLQEAGVIFAFCGVQNAYMMTSYPLTFYYILGSLFLVDFTALAILYILTGRELWKKRSIFMKNAVGPKVVTTEVKQPSNRKHDSLHHHGNIANTEIVSHGISIKRKRPNDKTTLRTFFMMFLVSVVFFLSYVPHLFLVYYFMAANMAAFPSSALTTWYGLLMRSFYVNNVADPLIYGFFSTEFRANIQAIPDKIRKLFDSRNL